MQTAKAQYIEQKIFSQDGENEFDRFGTSVGISDNFLICGAYSDDAQGTAKGAAYIYYNNAGTWEQHSKLYVTEGNDYDKFGSHVSIYGDYAISASTKYPNPSWKGAVAIFHYDSDTDTWEEQAFIYKPDVPDDAMFGGATDIDGTNAIIGMRTFNSAVGIPGAAFIYNYNGTTWTETAELIPEDAVVGDIVGAFVDISGDYAIVSAHCADNPSENIGYACIFKNMSGTWTEIKKLVGTQEGSYFGEDVAINENYAIVGACEDINGNIDQGAVYIYENNGDTWTQTDKITAPDGEEGARFGGNIDFNDNFLIIGANYASILDDYSAVYVYENIAGTWTYVEKIEPDDGQQDDFFGDAVALSGNTFIVGSHDHTVNGNQFQGAAYIYSPESQSAENDI